MALRIPVGFSPTASTMLISVLPRSARLVTEVSRSWYRDAFDVAKGCWLRVRKSETTRAVLGVDHRLVTRTGRRSVVSKVRTLPVTREGRRSTNCHQV